MRVSLILLLFVAHSPATAETTVAGATTVELRPIEAQLRDVYSKVGPAIVRLFSQDSSEVCLGFGVVVSADGDVLIRETRKLISHARSAAEIDFLFANGTRVKGTMRAWSTAWGIATARIEEDAQWPFVELEKNRTLQAGQLCVSIIHSRLTNRKYDTQPSLQLGLITHSARPAWFSHSTKLDNNSPAFSLDARLIGITTSRPLGDDSACTSAEILAQLLGQQGDENNLDVAILGAGNSEPSATALDEKKKPAVNHEELPTPVSKAAQATVRIRAMTSDQAWSGVLVDAAGHIATCAHHRRLPGEKVIIELSDGRNLQGEILGSNRIWDVGLAKITEQAEFPHVEMGSSVPLAPETPIWLIGYPKRRNDREPLVRAMTVASRKELPWSSTLYSSKGTQSFGGDSGGGVFDQQGRLVGVHEGTNPRDYGRHRRIELIKQQWEYLANGESLDSSSGNLNQRLASEFKDKEPASFVVTVLRDGQPCALGTIVASKGKILTKRSELYGAISVQFADGETLPATIHKSSRKHDLALLAVLRDGLPTASLSNSQTLPVGSLLAAAIPNKPLRIGVLAHSERSIPSNRGNGLASVKDTPSGVQVDEAWSNDFKLPLRPGDIIESIAGHPIPNLQSYLELVGDGSIPGKLVKNAGDPIEVSIKRNGVLLTFHFPQPPGEWSLQNESLRHAGFPSVFDTDITLSPRQCGGPIIDTGGRVLGISIAVRRDWGGQTHIIPSDIAQKFVAN